VPGERRAPDPTAGGHIRIGRHVPWRTFNNAILDRKDLGVQAKMVYVVLSSHATANDQRCFPSYATIAREASVSRRTAIRVVAELETTRLLVKTPRYRVESRSPTSNLYILFPADAPFDPEQERISPDGAVTGLDQMELSASDSLVVAGDSQTPGWCPPDTNPVTLGNQVGAGESPPPSHLSDQSRRSQAESEAVDEFLTRPVNETKERRGQDGQLEALLQTLPMKDRERLHEEVAAALAEALGTTPPPDFVIKTELLRRLMQGPRPHPERHDGGVT
jgi:DNA-binding transcriptional MocR family regulator